MKPKLLDLFCGAGGASMGYHQAGFDVTGVDINPQPRYPFEFVQADALSILRGMTYWPNFSGEMWRPGYFAAIHASPPCQDHSPLKSRAGLHGTGWLLGATLDGLANQPAVWVVENVGSAHNRADILLCGEMFGLRTIRHRRFTVDPRWCGLLAIPPHPRHSRATSTFKLPQHFAAGMHISVTGNVGRWVGPACMGIDWMTGEELSQAIPPPYTQFIGEQLIGSLALAEATRESETT